ncbi:type II toxin-antitoxin system RelE/ParE family toxin [Niveispirillum sp.]|uniref:type II toxin-antitoxin system RelE/ParE family toxin n=1 Tax=Niveispirillum sp. TaxID=1917217 RepID=UPI001B789529|nr:type II toxin-antitoxin system RelE/ParE family toxin [Niveispirillum sp.]
MRRLSYTKAAARDLADILSYLAERAGDGEPALRFVQRLKGQCRRLAELPGALGRPRDDIRPGIRSFAYRGYVILFRYEDDVLRIIAVIEGHRDIDTLMKR